VLGRASLVSRRRTVLNTRNYLDKSDYLNSNPKSVLQGDSNGMTPLHIVSSLGELDMANRSLLLLNLLGLLNSFFGLVLIEKKKSFQNGVKEEFSREERQRRQEFGP
jgi:hypothetical protein